MPWPTSFVRVRALTGTSLTSAAAGATLLAAAVLSGCIVENDSAPRGPARVEFGEVINLGYSCGGPLDTWTVKSRETGEEATAVCEQPILFLNLTPHATYTFDIDGRTRDGKTCWTGSCQIITGGSGSTLYPDCSSFIEPTCGL